MMFSPQRARGQTGLGVLIGVIATIAVLTLAGAIAWVAMGRCPMCGDMPHGPAAPSEEMRESV